MTRGEHVSISPDEQAQIIADYRIGSTINQLRARYHRGQDRIIQVLEAAGVQRRTNLYARFAKQGKARRELVGQTAGLGGSPSVREWGYIAGIFDAEGYLGLASRSGRNGRAARYRLAIVQKDVRLLEWLLVTLGAGRLAGPREQSGHNHDIGSFHLEAQRSIAQFCAGVLPFVQVKRRQVLECLANYQARYPDEFAALQVPPQTL